MAQKIEIIGLSDFPLIKPGDNLGEIIIDSLKKNKITLLENDIILIAQTIISKSLGRLRDLNKISPKEEAYELSKKIEKKAKTYGIPVKSPELIQAILDESKRIVKAEHVLITETNHGFICANAGIDKSNVEGDKIVALLPEDPDKEAQRIREILKDKLKKQCAIIITDSFGRPFRVGAVGVAIGVAGIVALVDKRGESDLYGHLLESTIIAQIDNLASAAQLIMGEADEGMPVVIIRGYNYQKIERERIDKIIRPSESDIFRNVNREEIINTLFDRRSYKHRFSSQKVKRRLIENCINIARYAPNAHNRQQWRYIILEKGKIREELIDAMNQKLVQDLQNDGKSQKFIQTKVNRTRANFLEAPYLVLISLEREELETYPDQRRNELEFQLGVQSVSASATYFLLALESKGLAACWYCAPLFAQEQVKNQLNLPRSFVPMAFITVGYPAKRMKTPHRKDLESILYKIGGNNKESER